MKHQFRLLAIIGSQKKNGNSYCLAKIVPDSLPVSYKTIQFAEANIDIVHDVSNARTAMIVVLRMISNPTRAINIVLDEPSWWGIALVFLRLFPFSKSRTYLSPDSTGLHIS
jgi:hypothetical protein